MALDLTPLTTKAECDEALASLTAELDGYQQRDSRLAYQDRQTDRTSTGLTGQLAGVNGEIAGLQAALATPGLPANMRKQYENKLRRANDYKDNLNERSSTRTGSAAVLTAVDNAQLDAQVAILTDAIAQVEARKGQLPG
jgi:hypothetical protein